MRLRQKVHDLKLLRTTNEKYIFFIDLKAAYDSVNHKRLFMKMQNKGYDQAIINAIKKIYSSAKMKLNTFQKSININRGVLQGGILSPWLFNIYIDDLIRDLKSTSFEVLAYADDLAVICRNKEELNLVIDKLEEWSRVNEIAVNPKKSGIMIVQNDRRDTDNHRGYPIKTTYKYLGIKINSNLDPRIGLEEINSKLEIYLKRNNWINKHNLTPKTLVMLASYYQHSRVIYGMSCFLDKREVIDSVERGNIRYTKSILGLSNQVNSNRLRVILNQPLNRHMLWALMRKTYKKYIDHFKEEAWIYNRINMEYENWFKSRHKEGMATDYHAFKMQVAEISIRHMANQDNIKVGLGYRETHRKNYFMAWDKRDGHLIRYLVNQGFFKGRYIPKCPFCNSDNSRQHVTNVCPKFENLREKTWINLKKTRNIEHYKGDLESAILDVYFNPSGSCQKELEVLKSFAVQLIIIGAERNKAGGMDF